mgnify:CR=1 FL=1
MKKIPIKECMDFVTVCSDVIKERKGDEAARGFLRRVIAYAASSCSCDLTDYGVSIAGASKAYLDESGNIR